MYRRGLLQFALYGLVGMTESLTYPTGPPGTPTYPIPGPAGPVGPQGPPGVTFPAAVIDSGGQVFNVKAYGAVGNGVANDTPALQAAIDAAYAAGGGIVFVPPTAAGYLCAGRLTVREGVTLQGAWQAPSMGVDGRIGSLSTARGSELRTTANAGSTTATLGFITLNRNATLQGLNISYPDQTKTNPPVAYPPAVYFAESGAAFEHHNGAIINVLILNPYIAVWCVNHERPYIDGLYGEPLNTGIHLDKCTDVARLQNVHFWPFWTIDGAAPIQAYRLANGVGYDIGRADGLTSTNMFAYGYRRGMYFRDMGNGTTHGDHTNVLMDGCVVGIDVDAIRHTFMTNVFLLGDTGGTGTGAALRWNAAAGVNDGSLNVTNAEFVSVAGSQVEITAASTGKLLLDRCVFTGNPSSVDVRVASTATRFVALASYWSRSSGTVLDLSAVVGGTNLIWLEGLFNYAPGVVNPSVRPYLIEPFVPGAERLGRTIMTSGSNQSLNISDASANGANLRLTGDGATTPSKSLRVQAGNFEIVDNSYATVLLRVQDSGSLFVSGGIQSSGNLLFTTDNTYDIGASGATRPRTIYAGTSVVAPMVATPLFTPSGNIIEQRNGANAQSLMIYNTTDAPTTNYERGSLSWTANAFWIESQRGGTGAARNLNLRGVNNLSLLGGTALAGWYVSTTGHFLGQTTNAYDIGDAAAGGRPRNIFVAGAVANRTKAGTPVDADVNTPTDGMMIIDTTASKIWCRIGGTWKQTVALT